MSNKLTKILTYCSLVLVILAVVITTAICLTTALSYKVTVDVVIQNIVPEEATDANVTVNINGTEVSTQRENTTLTVNAQKDREVTITFNMTDYNYVGLYNGTKDTYQGTDSILAEPTEYVYKFTVAQDTNYTLVVDAASFYQVSVGYNADKPVDEVEGGAIAVTASGAGVYADGDTANSYIVREGAEVSVSYEASEYTFTGWTNGDATSTDSVYTFVANGNTTVTGNFEAYVYYDVRVNYAFDEQAIGGNIAVTANGQEVTQEGITLKIRDGANVTLSVVSGTGYDFTGWTNVTDNATSATVNIAVSANAEYTANFNVIKYDIEYVDGEESTTVQDVVYGSTLQAGPEDIYANGWNKFLGWTLNGRTYTQAIFEGNNSKITLTASYRNQSEINYNFNVAATDFNTAGTISYNTSSGLDLASAPTRNYYNLIGISINGTQYLFNEEKTGFVDAQNTIDRILVDQNASTLTVTPIWELDGAPITVNLPSDSDFSGNIDITDQIAVDANIETLMVTEFFGIDASQIASFKIQYKSRTYTVSRTTADAYATISFADVFDTIGFDASASTELTFIFTSNVQ